MNTSQTPVVVKIGNTYNDPKHMEILIDSYDQHSVLNTLFPDAAVGSVAYVASGKYRFVRGLDGEWVESVTYVDTYTEFNPK